MRTTDNSFPAEAERQLFGARAYKSGLAEDGVPATHRLLVVMTRHMDSVGEVRMSHKDLACETRIPLDKIGFWLREMVRNRQLSEARPHKGGRRAVYRVLTPAAKVISS